MEAVKETKFGTKVA